MEIGSKYKINCGHQYTTHSGHTRCTQKIADFWFFCYMITWQVMWQPYLDVLSFEVSDLISKPAWGIDRAHHCLSLLHDAVLQSNTEIIFTKPWSLVNHACTTLICHIGVTGERERERERVCIMCACMHVYYECMYMSVCVCVFVCAYACIAMCVCICMDSVCVCVCAYSLDYYTSITTMYMSIHKQWQAYASTTKTLTKIQVSSNQ